MNNLASMYYLQGRYAEALPMSSRVLDARTRVLGEEHPQTLTAMHNVANNYSGLKKFAEAEPLFIKALAGRGRVLGAAHPLTTMTVSSLAEMYIKQRRYSEAESLLLGALAVIPEGKGPTRQGITRDLVRLYEAAGQPAKVAERRATLPSDTPARP